MTYCACGYIKERPIWCGNGHNTGQCPPNTKKNIEAVTQEANRPRCEYCGEAAPYGDARNAWMGMHKHRVRKLKIWLSQRLSKTGATDE